MIRKLQKRLVIYTISALLLALLLNLIGMSAINYYRLVKNADELLDSFWKNRDLFSYVEITDSADLSMEANKNRPNSPFFSVMADDQTGEILKIAPSYYASHKFASIAEGLTKEIASQKSQRGFVRSYRYIRQPESDHVDRIVFLDCTKELNSFYKFLLIALGITFAGYTLALTVIGLSYNRILHAIYEDMKKYRQYITNAGHEFKTPIAIILADVDVLEMDLGKNEWINDIRKQIKRLDGLTSDLGYLARMEQAKESLPTIDFPVSDIITEAASSFQLAAASRDIELVIQVQPMLSMHGNEKSIHQLVATLMDNALKYSPGGSQIRLTFEQKNTALHLTTFNRSNYPIPKESLPLLFDRFYRIEHAENSPANGSGIGLSIAKAIVNAHNGKIHALSPDGQSLQINVTFPI